MTLLMGQQAPGGRTEPRLDCELGHFVTKLSTVPATQRLSVLGPYYYIFNMYHVHALYIQKS